MIDGVARTGACGLHVSTVVDMESARVSGWFFNGGVVADAQLCSPRIGQAQACAWSDGEASALTAVDCSYSVEKRTVLADKKCFTLSLYR